MFGLEGREVLLRATATAHDPRRALAVPRRAETAKAPDEPSADLLLLGRYGRSRSDSGASDIYLGGPDGYSPDRVQRVPSWGACVSLCADFDDDGRVDLAIANGAETDAATAPGSYIYRNEGPGFAPRLAQILPPNQTHGIACADLDRDEYLDLVLAAMSEPEILVYRGGADGFDLEHPRRIRLELDGETFANQRFIQLVDPQRRWLARSVRPDDRLIPQPDPVGRARRLQHRPLAEAGGLASLLGGSGGPRRRRPAGADRRRAHGLEQRAARQLGLHLLERPGRIPGGPADAAPRRGDQFDVDRRLQQ